MFDSEAFMVYVFDAFAWVLMNWRMCLTLLVCSETLPSFAQALYDEYLVTDEWGHGNSKFLFLTLVS